ncbi:uncharacterized protein LOC144952437 [Lampetra fluviatilis]
MASAVGGGGGVAFGGGGGGGGGGLCFNAQYVHALLVSGFHFNAHTWRSIVFSETAGGSSLGWTLGRMLNLTNVVPGRPSRRPSPPPSLLPPLVLGALAAAMALVLALALMLRGGGGGGGGCGGCGGGSGVAYETI